MSRGFLRIQTVDKHVARRYLISMQVLQNFEYRDRDLWLGVYSDKLLVGVCCFSYMESTGNIMHNYVTLRYRRRGALAKILIRIKRFARDNSIGVIYSFVTPLALNSHLRAGAKFVCSYKNKNTKVMYENF